MSDEELKELSRAVAEGGRYVDDCIPNDMDLARRNACTLVGLACHLYLALHDRTAA